MKWPTFYSAYLYAIFDLVQIYPLTYPANRYELLPYVSFLGYLNWNQFLLNCLQLVVADIGLVLLYLQLFHHLKNYHFIYHKKQILLGFCSHWVTYLQIIGIYRLTSMNRWLIQWPQLWMLGSTTSLSVDCIWNMWAYWVICDHLGRVFWVQRNHLLLIE